MTSAEGEGGIPPKKFAAALIAQADVAYQLSLHAERVGRQGAAQVAQIVSLSDREVAARVEGLEHPLDGIDIGYPADNFLETGINITRAITLVNVVKGYQRVLAPIGRAELNPPEIVSAGAYGPEKGAPHMEAIRWKREVLLDIYGLAGIHWPSSSTVRHTSHLMSTRSPLGLTIYQNSSGIGVWKH
jgi:hypothetical protein